jgi:hypothetical protein
MPPAAAAPRVIHHHWHLPPGTTWADIADALADRAGDHHGE